ncbi:MAG: hypothetical protein J6S91_06980, partial [Treponema sp.]|nr:hypothetical protein [Treponema sp.]
NTGILLICNWDVGIADAARLAIVILARDRTEFTTLGSHVDGILQVGGKRLLNVQDLDNLQESLYDIGFKAVAVFGFQNPTQQLMQVERQHPALLHALELQASAHELVFTISSHTVLLKYSCAILCFNCIKWG